jgi:hypothetical protein
MIKELSFSEVINKKFEGGEAQELLETSKDIKSFFHGGMQYINSDFADREVVLIVCQNGS